MVVLLPLLGFALVYGLPLLGLRFAIDHGLYVAAGVAAASFLRLDGDERVQILEYCTGTDGAHLALVEIDGDTEYGDGLGPLRLAVEVERLEAVEDETLSAPQKFPGTLFVGATEKSLASQVTDTSNLGGAA